MYRNDVKEVKDKENTTFLSILVSFSVDLIIALVVVIIVTTFIVQNQRVEGYSMEPTMTHKDVVIMNKWIYHFKEPALNDIIGFYAPSLNKQLVKRIVGLPGDIIDFKNNKIGRAHV